jgi:hypothetical protein
MSRVNEGSQFSFLYRPFIRLLKLHTTISYHVIISKHISYNLQQCKKLWAPYIAAIVSQTVVHGGSLGGSQSVSEGKAFLKLYQTLNEWKTDPYMSVPELSCLLTSNRKQAN